MTLHNDESTLFDKLERESLVQEVGETIATCNPPHVFGVHGDWGLGKTSFLQQLQWYLSGECPQQGNISRADRDRLNESLPGGNHKRHTSVVWFEAWRYQHEAVPVIALLQEMRSQLSWHVKARQQAAKLGTVAVRGALFSMEEVTKKIGIQASKFEQAGERWERENLAVALPSHTMREHLTKVIGDLIPKTKSGEAKPRLVIMIDDLDRCEGDVAYRLLEGLKIYLTLDNCVFVLGMNQKVMEEAIGRSIGLTEGGNDEQQSAERAIRAAAYLEKLCQNVWRLPSVEDPKALLLEWIEDDALSARIEAAIDDFACLPPNPRRLKGYANLLQRLASRLDTVHDPNDDDAVLEARLLMIVAYAYQFHNDLFVRWEHDPDLYDRVLDWSRESRIDLPVFGQLERACTIIADETVAVGYRIESRFPDPTDARVFWIQRLVHEIGLADAKADQFRRYLREIR